MGRNTLHLPDPNLLDWSALFRHWRGLGGTNHWHLCAICRGGLGYRALRDRSPEGD